MTLDLGPNAQTRQTIDTLLAALALHAGDTKENAEHVQGLVAQDTMSAPEAHSVSTHLNDAFDHVNQALKALRASKLILRRSGTS